MGDSEIRVLIVDDDPQSRELIETILEDPTYETLMACDGIEAWEILQRRHDTIDVVLLDRIMPRMDGMTFLSRIKKNPLLADIPVIIETGVTDGPEIIEGIKAGAYYYLTKPLDHEMLISQVDAAASDYQRFRKLRIEVQKRIGMLSLMRSCVFEFSTPEEANDLGTYLAHAYPDPERVVMGLSELLLNAVEHGNLEITYQEKSELNRKRRWYQEVQRRLALPEYADRKATVHLEREDDCVTVTVRDQGSGFDPEPYLQIDPTRVFDSHGRGIAIANLLSFDSLEYQRGGSEVIARVGSMKP
jgi:DNA-binding response OmpR family regulator